MTNKKIPQRDRSRPMLAAIVALFAMIATSTFAFAQQGQFQPLPPHRAPRPRRRRAGIADHSGTSGRRRSVGDDSTPGTPTGAGATVPPHQLKSQQGYAQVTVTVTDQEGRYVTGLQKSDFKLQIDGQDRPIEFFRQDLNTPVSVGILVDTLGQHATEDSAGAGCNFRVYPRFERARRRVHVRVLQPAVFAPALHYQSLPGAEPSRTAACVRPDLPLRHHPRRPADGSAWPLRQEGAVGGHRRHGQHQPVHRRTGGGAGAPDGRAGVLDWNRRPKCR